MSFYDTDDDARSYIGQPGGRPAREHSLVSESSRAESSRAGAARGGYGAAGAAGRGGTRSESFVSRLQSVSPGPSGYGPTEDDMASLAGGPVGGMQDEDEHALAMMLDREDDEMDDMKRMCRAWVRERGTLDIMAWEGDLIDGLMDKLEQQASCSTVCEDEG